MMKKISIGLLYTLFLLNIYSCKNADVNFLGFFDKKVSIAEDTIPKVNEVESSAEASVNVRLFLNDQISIDEVNVYLSNVQGLELLPDSAFLDEFLFSGVEPGKYVIYVKDKEGVLKEEGITLYSGENAQHDLLIGSTEPLPVILNNVFSFDFEEIPYEEVAETSEAIFQVFDGNSQDVIGGLVLELQGERNYKDITGEGGDIIFDSIAIGDYELKLYDEQSGIAYTNSKGNLKINPESAKDVRIYVFEGEQTDTTQIIEGVLLDYNNRQPLANAEVKVLTGNNSTFTNSNGEFSIKVGFGPQLISFRQNGYIANCIRVIASPNSLLSETFYMVKPVPGFKVNDSGKKTQLSDDIQMDIPPGALEGEKAISFTLLPEEAYYTGFPSGTAIPVFHLEPSGLQFKKPISISFKSSEIEDYETGDKVMIDVFAEGKPVKNKLIAEMVEDKMVVSMSGFNSSYSSSSYSTTRSNQRRGGWRFFCNYTATVSAHDKPLGSIRCYNNPFRPETKNVRRFVIVSSCFGNRNVSCDDCAISAVRRGMRQGRAYACAKTLTCAAPNCHKAFLIAQIPTITFSGAIYRRRVRLRNGALRWQWRVVRRNPLPSCHNWTPKWDDSRVCCTGSECNRNMPDADLCLKWICDGSGKCISRPTNNANRLAKLCLECDPKTGREGKDLCPDKVCDKCVDGECKPIKHFHVKTTTVTTTVKKCPPDSDQTNTTTTTTDIPVACPPPATPPPTSDTHIIPGPNHACNKTIIVTTISWSTKKVNPS